MSETLNYELDEEFDFNNNEHTVEENKNIKLLEQLENVKNVNTDNVNDKLAHENFQKLMKDMSNKSPQERMAFLTELQRNMSKMANKDLKDVNIDEKEKRRRELRELINAKKNLRTGRFTKKGH